MSIDINLSIVCQAQQKIKSPPKNCLSFKARSVSDHQINNVHVIIFNLLKKNPNELYLSHIFPLKIDFDTKDRIKARFTFYNELKNIVCV